MTQPDPTVNRPIETDRDSAEADRVEHEPSPDTTVYMRSRRTPTLAFWVVLALVAPAVAALLVAPFLGVSDPGGFFNLAMVAVLAIGAPLAALACVVDMVLERRRAREDRDSRKDR